MSGEGLHRDGESHRDGDSAAVHSPIVRIVGRLLLAPSLVIAVALVVKGTGDIGDGFSAAVIVTLAVSVQYLTFGAAVAERQLPLVRTAPGMLVAGLAIAVAAGMGPVLAGRSPFTLYPAPGTEPVSVGTLKLTTGLAFEAGVFLLVTGALLSMLHHLATARPGLISDDDDAAAGAGRRGEATR